MYYYTLIQTDLFSTVFFDSIDKPPENGKGGFTLSTCAGTNLQFLSANIDLIPVAAFTKGLTTRPQMRFIHIKGPFSGGSDVPDAGRWAGQDRPGPG
jgi:hypothetical protein